MSRSGTKDGPAPGAGRAGPRTREVRRVTFWGLAANLALAALKFVFGTLGASQALIADAVHSLSDSSTDLAVLIGAPYWSAPADSRHPYGHGRIETLITVLIGASLGAVGAGLIFHTVASLPAPRETLPGWLAFAAACSSIVSKELLFQWTIRVGRRLRSPALVANAWHHRSDSLSSVPVAIAVLGAKWRPEWIFLDAVATLIVSVFILQAAWRIVWPALNQLADTAASEEMHEQLRRLCEDIKGVKEAHAIRTRHLGAGYHVDLHVLVDPRLSVREGHDIASLVELRLREAQGDVVDVLVHIEPHEAP